MLKVKARQKLNLGHLEGMPEGHIAYLMPGAEAELPDCHIVRWYIEHGSLELIEEVEEKPKDEKKAKKKVVDKPKEEKTVKE